MVRAVAFFATACILPGAPVARPEPRESRPGREIQWLCPPDDQGAETPPCPLERAQQQLCQLKQLRQVLEENRNQLAQGKRVLDSLYDDADDLMNDENEMTILEWLLKASFRWVNRGMDRVDPLLTTAQRSRFVKLLEASNQTIDQTLDAFYASAFPCQGGLLVRELQFAVAGELAALRRDNLRLLALMRRTDS